MKTSFSRLALATALSFSVLAGSIANASSTLEQQIEQIRADYEPKFEAIKAEGQKLNDEAPRPNEFEATVNTEFEIHWKRTTIKLDLPEIRWKRRDIKLDLPQVAMKTTSIKWDNPEVYWEVTKVGEYPCFKGWKWYSCDIKTKVPQVRMVRREAKFDVPQFSWDTTTMKLDIPEFFTNRTEIKLDLPQFKVKDVKAEIGKQKAAADAIERKATALGEQQKADIEAAVRSELADKQAETIAQFDDGIAKLSTAIDRLKAAGVNPEAVPSESGPQNLVAMLADVTQKREETLRRFADIVSKPSTAG